MRSLYHIYKSRSIEIYISTINHPLSKFQSVEIPRIDHSFHAIHVISSIFHTSSIPFFFAINTRTRSAFSTPLTRCLERESSGADLDDTPKERKKKGEGKKRGKRRRTRQNDEATMTNRGRVQPTPNRFFPQVTNVRHAREERPIVNAR